MRGGMGGRFGSNGEKFNLRKLNKQALTILKFNLKGLGKQLIAAILLTIVISGAHTVLPLITKTAIDDYVVAKHLSGLALLVIAYISIAFIQWMATSGQTYLARKIAYQVITTIRNQVYSHLIKLDIDFHNKNKVGDLSSAIMNDVETLYNLISQGFIYFISDLITIVAIGISLYMLNSRLALVLIITMPIIIILTNIIGRLLRKSQQQVRKNIAKLTTGIEQNVSGVKAVKTFSQEDNQSKKVEKLSQETRKANIKATAISALLFPIMDLAGAIGLALVVWQGGLLYINGVITAGVLMAGVSYSRRIYGPLMDLSQIYTTYQTAAAALDRIHGFLSIKPKIEYTEDKTVLNNYDIDLKDIVFSYNKKDIILNNINLTIKSGEKVGVAGPSGAGKSTIIKLVARLYDPDKGTVKIGCKDIKDISKVKLRQTVQVIPQDTYLFPGSVWENISYGLKGKSLSDVVELVDSLELNSFFARLPKGLETFIGENGKTLSGGQRQAIAIARAMLRNPKILILDEAASNLDPQIEKLIFENTKKLWKDKTIIMITHRTTSLSLVDKVYKLENQQLDIVDKSELELAGWSE